MLRNMEMNLMLSALLLICSWGGRAQEFMSPSVNIIAELEKIKLIEERLKSQDTTVTLLNSSVEELKRENAALKTMADTFQKKLYSLQQENEARKVAFSASLLDSGTGHTGPFSSVKSPLIYKKVFSNYRNGYDSSTGIFTAPLKGVYYFRFYAHCHGGHRLSVSLYKNDQRQCSVYTHKPPTNSNAGNGIVLTVEEGDQIYTKLSANSWVYDDPGSYTSFSGFLLFPL
ncbi:complement component 1, q subcomponent-like 4 like isoform X1 [Astyanax mexicanus]|uniref:complement component 1, q subcomponent-like 4 like isoform X1 n=1 Tax=Astyanax mexicanus TaxID=7994 RepID=UPI0020CB5878|nr:complement component 1, q subcomponent-like 4 like isoform X1 [Astyanax mexicanus]